jgi:sterol desaturase/sphingolipid hydroxylase (fatty acid hydroxylase superfamily)
MADTLLAAAATCYLVALAGAFVVVAAWETLAPLRAASAPLAQRWRHNIGLLALNQGLLQLLMPLLPLTAAAWAQQRDWGLLPLLGLPPAVALVAAVVMLDVCRWLLHRCLHAWPWLWRLHRVHHSDIDYDCTIGLRFHPLEALLTASAMVGAVMLLGAPPLAVLVSDLLTVALGYFAHANASLPPRWEQRLRRWLVTPDLHRIHHSSDGTESMSNFGAILSLWDRAFGSYRPQARGGALGMSIGLAEWRDPAWFSLRRLLLMPWSPDPPPRP